MTFKRVILERDSTLLSPLPGLSNTEVGVDN